MNKWILLLTLLFSPLRGDDLIVGTNAEFPPFAFIENGEIKGFDIDIAKEIAKRLGKGIQFKDLPFEALIPEIILKKVDFVAAGMSYTEERAKRVSFTKSYIKGDPLVIFSKEELSLDDLPGKSVVVVEGFTADFFMTDQKGITLTRLPNQADAFMSVKSGRVDAFVTAKSTTDAFFKYHERSTYKITEIPGTCETCALVVPKQSSETLALLQKTLGEMEGDGTLEQIKLKWGLL